MYIINRACIWGENPFWLQVTHNQENVLDLHWMEVGEIPAEQLDPLSRTMAFHLRKLIDERDESSEVSWS